MWVESLESRCLPAATNLVEAPSNTIQTNRVLFHAEPAQSAFPKILRVNLIGTYGGSYSLSNNSTEFSGASLTVTKQTAHGFSGRMNLAFFGSAVVRFTAQLTSYRKKGLFGAGYYATLHYNTPTAHLLLRDNIVPGQDSLEPYSGKTELSFLVTGIARGWTFPLTRTDNSTASFWP